MIIQNNCIDKDYIPMLNRLYGEENVNKVLKFADTCGIEYYKLVDMFKLLKHINLIEHWRVDMAKRVFPNDKVDYVVKVLDENYDQDMSYMKLKGWDYTNEIEPIIYFFVDKCGALID